MARSLLACLLFLIVAAPGGRADEPAEALDRAIAEAARRAAPAVVAIEVERDEAKPAEGDRHGIPAGPGGRMRSLFDYYSRPKGPVSGVVVEADGFIATSLYNVAGEVRSIVVLREGVRLPATLLGWSELHDVALVKVDARDLPVLPEADAARVVPGRFCVLVGRSPVPARPTTTWGVVSAVRRWDDRSFSGCRSRPDLGGPRADTAAHYPKHPDAVRASWVRPPRVRLH